MEGKINIGNFKNIMVLREQFATNRKTDKIEVLSFHFSNSEKLANLKHGQRLGLMKEGDKYKEKDFNRKVKIIGIYKQK